jgi:hypothetical protein
MSTCRGDMVNKNPTVGSFVSSFESHFKVDDKKAVELLTQASKINGHVYIYKDNLLVMNDESAKKIKGAVEVPFALLNKMLEFSDSNVLLQQEKTKLLAEKEKNTDNTPDIDNKLNDVQSRLDAIKDAIKVATELAGNLQPSARKADNVRDKTFVKTMLEINKKVTTNSYSSQLTTLETSIKNYNTILNGLAPIFIQNKSKVLDSSKPGVTPKLALETLKKNVVDELKKTQNIQVEINRNPDKGGTLLTRISSSWIKEHDVLSGSIDDISKANVKSIESKLSNIENKLNNIKTKLGQGNISEEDKEFLNTIQKSLNEQKQELKSEISKVETIKTSINIANGIVASTFVDEKAINDFKEFVEGNPKLKELLDKPLLDEKTLDKLNGLPKPLPPLPPRPLQQNAQLPLPSLTPKRTLPLTPERRGSLPTSRPQSMPPSTRSPSRTPTNRPMSMPTGRPVSTPPPTDAPPQLPSLAPTKPQPPTPKGRAPLPPSRKDRPVSMPPPTVR